MITRPVNLLPRQLQKLRLQRVLATASILGGLLGVVVVYGGVMAIQTLESSVQTAASGILTVESASSNTPSALFADATARVGVMQQLATRELDWKKVITLSGGVTAKDATITSLTVAQSPGVLTYQVQGKSPSTLSYARYIETLRQNSVVSSIVDDSQNFDSATGEITFSLTYTVKSQQLAVPVPVQ